MIYAGQLGFTVTCDHGQRAGRARPCASEVEVLDSVEFAAKRWRATRNDWTTAELTFIITYCPKHTSDLANVAR